MKLKIFAAGLIASLALSACGAGGTPTLTSADVQATAQSAAFTVVAKTQQSNPTDVPPPTETLQPTETQTETPAPSPTIDPSLSTATLLPTETLVGQSVAPTADNCNKTLTEWQVPTIKLIISYEYQPKSKDDKTVLSLWVRTALGECGFIPVYGGTASGPEGNYSAAAFVDGKKDFKVFGGFLLTGGSWQIVIRNETIVAKGGCYPNC